jgi:hypothetical protein
MSQRHNPSSAKQFAQEQGSRGYGVGSSQEYDSPSPSAQSQSKLNRGSNAFVFTNAQIAADKGGRPNALSKETTGTVYGGAIGEQQ